jgi:hypothetical protein
MTQHPTTHRRTRRCVHLAAAFIAGALTLTACGSDSATSDRDPGRTTTTTPKDARAAESICQAAVTAAATASSDLSGLANAHIDAFNAAIDAIEAWDTGDRVTFAAKAAEFRAFAANEPNQTARIEKDKETVARTARACRTALDGEPMAPACQAAVDLLAEHRTHTYEVIEAVDELYSAGEQLLAAAAANNVSMVEAAMSQIAVAGTTLESALADDEAKFDAADAAVGRCLETDDASTDQESLRPSVGTPAGQ